MTEQLKYLSENILLQLSDKIDSNIDRYIGEGFGDYEDDSGWGIPLKSVQVNLEKLSELDGDKSSDAEVKNSLLVWEALNGMTPAMACEERIWARLAHIECFEYSQKRWLEGKSAEQIPQQVSIHFFARNKRRRTHDNAISRLWWNAYIAKIASPSDLNAALKVMLQKADLRQTIVERTPLVSRPQIAGGAIRAFMADDWLTSKEQNWRNFITAVNKYGGGILFEAMNNSEIDEYMKKCSDLAKSAV